VLQRKIKFVGHTALLALRLWLAERKVDSIALNLAAALEQTLLHDLVAQPAVVSMDHHALCSCLAACHSVIAQTAQGRSKRFFATSCA